MDRFKTKAPLLSRANAREEADRLVKEAMAKGSVSVTKGKTRIQAQCSKCGAENRVEAQPGESRVTFKCKECGHSQLTL